MAENPERAELVIVGGGPGGYAAAFLAADYGLPTTMIDPEAAPGGTCLYRGCIPSKAFLHAAHTLDQTREAAAYGLKYAEPEIDIDRLRAWKDEVVSKLTGALAQHAARKNVRYLRGRARFTGADELAVSLVEGGEQRLGFQHAIIATGSRPLRLPEQPDSPLVMAAKGALELPDVPGSLLVVGGGYIGLELGQVYASLGSRVTVVEMMPSVLPGVDVDLVSVLKRRIKDQFAEILLRTKVGRMKPQKNGVQVTLVDKDGQEQGRRFDRVLVAVGRLPASSDLGLESTRVQVDSKGFVQVDRRRRTAEPSIHAIGDVIGQPMLAHKAHHEARVAVEDIVGLETAFEPRAIPAVVYTDPEIAWCGLTQTEAQARKLRVKVAKLPWGGSGRALTMNRDQGLTKLLVDPDSQRILGVGMAGPHVGELIAEGALALEMGAVASDLRLTIHPHPTLSEMLMETAASLFEPQTERQAARGPEAATAERGSAPAREKND
jgi:dihydrolipoamide dehydrogenase